LPKNQIAPWICGKVFAFPIAAIPRDDGDSGDPPMALALGGPVMAFLLA